MALLNFFSKADDGGPQSQSESGIEIISFNFEDLDLLISLAWIVVIVSLSVSF